MKRHVVVDTLIKSFRQFSHTHRSVTPQIKYLFAVNTPKRYLRTFSNTRLIFAAFDMINTLFE